MPPRGSSGGMDFTPILTHYLFLGTTLLAVIGWLVAFVGQIATNVLFDRSAVGSLWFAIWLQAFLIVGVIWTLASDSIAMHRFQIATFGAVAIVFAVDGAGGIFTASPAPTAQGVGWLLLSIVDILWVLYFTSEEDSLALHLFNSLGTGGLTPPGRRSRRTRSTVMAGGGGSVGGGNGGGGNGYSSPYNQGGYDPKLAPAPMSGPVMSGPGSFGGVGGPGSFGGPGSAADTRSMRSMNRPISDVSNPVMHSPQMGGGELNAGPSSPLMGSGNAGVGAGGGPSLTNLSAGGPDASTVISEPGQAYTAKALYAYTASSDDPNEISFTKGEIMEILDKQGKWWQAKKADGRIGIAPSNYLQII